MSSRETNYDIKCEIKKNNLLRTRSNIKISEKGSMIGSEVSKMVESEAPDLFPCIETKVQMTEYEIISFVRNSETN